MGREIPTTREKALDLNLNDRRYGSFAEIGAGQEVARHFFQAGAAAGTVAKSVSAYDKVISDEIYGNRNTGRFVSKERLLCMLDKEYDSLIHSLQEVRFDDSTYFAFANTVATKSFGRKNECHAWLGMRFQRKPAAEPTDIIVHIRMLDNNFLMQQEVIGYVGVNMIYGAFHYLDDQNIFVESLIDNIAEGRVEVDVILVDGANVASVSNRLISLHMVKAGLTRAVLFDQDGQPCQASEALYKKPVLIQRGSFRPVTLVNENMQKCAQGQFFSESFVKDEKPFEIMEITFQNLKNDGEIAERDFLDRIDLLTSLGHSVLITNYTRHDQFAPYIARNCKRPFALVLGISNLRELLKEEYYEDLPGGILEAFGKLFTAGGRLYIYPEYDLQSGKLHTAENIEIADHLQSLYKHLIDNHCIVGLNGCDVSHMNIYSRDVLHMIQNEQPGWEEFVPPEAVDLIKGKQLWTP